MNMLKLPKPELPSPFPNTPRYWKDPITGLVVPKFEAENIEYRANLLRKAENDPILQADLMAASKESQLFWINTFAWTYHQFDVDPDTGRRIQAIYPHSPFITWEVQDGLFYEFDRCLELGEDILIDKARDMGASWMCVDYIHHKWLFRSDSQMLEMSRIEDYVDKPGNMKALFQKHDYINRWLPGWMVPEGCLPGGKNRTKMHLMNPLNGSCIDGESTTEMAASGDRRVITLLDEFAKVKNGSDMRSATRDASFMRIINSTPFGPGTEYAKWKKSGQIKVYVLPYWSHPQKGAGRYLKQDELGKWEIRSPWFDEEEKVRSKKEIAREILREDAESGDQFFTSVNIDKHRAIYGKQPIYTMNINLKKDLTDSVVERAIKTKDVSIVNCHNKRKGPLKVWTRLILGRPDQSKTYVFGMDISKGQGASNSVISVKCKETGEKIAEWVDANVPPYEMAYIAVALALWVGGANPHRLPFFKWENNGPGWDFGRKVVKVLHYPYYYRKVPIGKVTDKKTQSYGWHNSVNDKIQLLSIYDAVLAKGGYINHSVEALEELTYYIWFDSGAVGPSDLVEESESAKKTHGDRVMADALTLDDSEMPNARPVQATTSYEECFANRYNKYVKAKKAKFPIHKRKFDFAVG